MKKLLPIHFENAEDLNKFLKNLISLGLIIITESNDIVCTDYEKLRKQFLKANDGNIYSLADVQQFIKDASDDEIKALNITFLTADKKEITLSQLKLDPEMFIQLPGHQETAAFIKRLNPNLYSLTELPSLNTAEAIMKAKTMFKNYLFYQTISSSNLFIKLGKTLQSFASLSASLTDPSVMLLPTAEKSAGFITTINQSIIKVTLIQQARLKNLLLKAMENTTDQQEINNLDLWIKDIERENRESRELFKSIIASLKSHTATTKQTQLRYQRIIDSDPSLKETRSKLEILQQEQASLIKTLGWQKKVLNVLKNVAIYATVGSIMALPFIALIAATILLAPATMLAAPLFVLTSSLLIALCLNREIGSQIGRVFTRIIQAIENGFDSILDKKQKKIAENTAQIAALSSNILFMDNVSKIDKNQLNSGASHDALIAELESDLREVAQLRIEEDVTTVATKKAPASQANSASTLGVFGGKVAPDAKTQKAEMGDEASMVMGY